MDKQAYKYNALGQAKEMTDQDETVHVYAFDVVGRPTSDAVTLKSGNPHNLSTAVLRQTTEYDTAGRAYLFTSYNATSGGSVVNQVKREFNKLGQLIAEWQDHDSDVDASAPAVRYAYSFDTDSPTPNHSRLTSMTYPDGRVLVYGYSSGLDSAISRASYLSDVQALAPKLEQYSYLGLGTIVERIRPEASVRLTYVEQSGDTALAVGVSPGDQYTGLDRFGRVVDQRWRETAGTPSDVDRFKYAYDRNSNRLYKDNTLSAANSELYQADGGSSGYDLLNRLTEFQRGTLSDANSDGVYDTVATSTRTQSWTLDALGNWASSSTDGTSTSRTHDKRNELTGVGAAGLTYDAAGNMTKDETGKQYTYDAWGRITKVTDSATPTPNILVTYANDPLGRRIAETRGTAVTDLYYSSQWQVLEEREGTTSSTLRRVKYQNVWGLGYVDALIVRDSPSSNLDTSFDGDGKLVTNLGSNEVAYAVVAYPDGRVLLGGTSNNKYALVRYNADGTLDTSFDGDGKLVGSTSGAGFYDLAVQSDGKIVAVGYSGGDFLVVRLTSNGSLDTSFSGDGIFTESFGGSGDAAYGVALDYSQSATSPRIVVAGVAGILYGSTSDFAVLRLNADGTVDTSFDTDGKNTADIAGNADAAADVAVDSAGKVVVVGTSRLLSPTRDRIAVARFNANGSLDTSFSSDGKIDVDTGSDWGEGHAVALTGDGKIVVGGAVSETTDIFYRRFGLVRLNGDGTMDTSFDSDGIVRSSNFGGSVWGDSEDIDYDIAVLGDGRIVAAGSTEFVDNMGNPVASFAVARYNVNGSPDTTFDSDGKLTANFGSSTNDYGRAVAVLPGGRVLVAGESNGDFALLRLGERLYAQQDANYNVTSITDAAGTVLERYLYDPYGTVMYTDGGWGGRGSSSLSWVYLHQGGRYDASSTLYHFRNRDYSPSLGRWSRQDPLGYVDGYNVYQYEQSNPVRRVDALGTWSSDPPPVPSCCSAQNVTWDGFWNVKGGGLIIAGAKSDFSFTGTDSTNCTYKVRGAGDGGSASFLVGYLSFSFTFTKEPAGVWPISMGSSITGGVVGAGGSVKIPVSVAFADGTAGTIQSKAGWGNFNTQGGFNIFVLAALLKTNVHSIEYDIAVPPGLAR